MLAFYNVESADARSDVDTDRIRNRRRNLQARHTQRKIRAGDGDLNEPAHLLQFFLGDPVQRVEITDFRGDATIKAGGVKLSDRADTTRPRDQSFPNLIGADAESTNEADTCYHYPTPQLRFSSEGILARKVIFSPGRAYQCTQPRPSLW